MSKLIIVFDDPGSCRRCPAMNSKYACNAARRPFSEGTVVQIKHGEECRPIWCPAIAVPEHKLDWSDERSYEAGWNDCLDVIGVE